MASGVRYVIPECVKGQTARLGRVIDGTKVELVDVLADGYHVADADPTLIKEEVTVAFYRPYCPTVRGFEIEGPDAATTNQGIAVQLALDPDIDLRVRNCRSAGGHFFKCHKGFIRMMVEGASRLETGYGSQISECAGVRLDGTGWNNRRLFDVSGNAPSDGTVISGLSIDGGGAQADGQIYYPLGNVSNFGAGAHGAGRNTVYENNYFAGVQMAIFDRGRGTIVRDNVFGPGVKYPVTIAFGGRTEVYDNVIDAEIFGNFEKTSERSETSGFGLGAAEDAYAECVVVLGANMPDQDPDTTVILRENFVRTKKNIVQFETTSGSARTLPNISCYENDAEYFPLSVSDITGTFGKKEESSAGPVILSGGRHGQNRQRTASGNTQPVVYGTGVSLSSGAGVRTEFGDGRWSVVLANNTVAWFPAPQNGRNKLLVAVSVEQEDVSYFYGWLNKNSASVRLIAGAQYQALATVPTGVEGSPPAFQMHFTDGKLFIANRLNFNRTFNIEIFSMD